MKARASREGTAAKMRGLSGRLPGLGQGPRGDDGGAPAGVSDLFRVDVDKGDQIYSFALEVFGDAPADLPRAPDDGSGVGGEGAKPEVVGFDPEKNFDGVPTVPAREPVRAFAPGEEDGRDFGKAPAGEVEPEPKVVVFGPSEVFVAVYRRQVLPAHHHRGVGQGAFDVDLPGDVFRGEVVLLEELVWPAGLGVAQEGHGFDGHRAASGHHLGYDAVKPAVDVVLFSGDDTTGFLY